MVRRNNCHLMVIFCNIFADMIWSWYVLLLTNVTHRLIICTGSRHLFAAVSRTGRTYKYWTVVWIKTKINKTLTFMSVKQSTQDYTAAYSRMSVVLNALYYRKGSRKQCRKFLRSYLNRKEVIVVWNYFCKGCYSFIVVYVSQSVCLLV